MKTIMIAIPNEKYIESETFKSVYNLTVPDGYETYFYPFVNNQIDDARNTIADESKKYDYLFFVDSDMVLPQDALVKLIQADKPIISGLYIQRIPDTHTLEVYMDLENGGVGNIPYELINHRGIVEIAACGMGCCLIKTEIFKTMEYPYFHYTSALDHTYTVSEDVYFCINARKKGYTVWADETIRCNHIGNILYNVKENTDDINDTFQPNMKKVFK